jgi:hypothetical protein
VAWDVLQDGVHGEPAASELRPTRPGDALRHFIIGDFVTDVRVLL